jgi:hypothetical protein
MSMLSDLQAMSAWPRWCNACWPCLRNWPLVWKALARPGVRSTPDRIPASSSTPRAWDGLCIDPKSPKYGESIPRQGTSRVCEIGRWRGTHSHGLARPAQR